MKLLQKKQLSKSLRSSDSSHLRLRTEQEDGSHARLVLLCRVQDFHS
jgi:hypothetical protein